MTPTNVEWFDQPVILSIDSPATDLIAAVDHHGAILVRGGPSKCYAFRSSDLRIRPWFVKMRRMRYGIVAHYIELETLATMVPHGQDPPANALCMVEVAKTGAPLRVGFNVTDPQNTSFSYFYKSGAPPTPKPPSSAAATTSITRYPTVKTSVDLAPGVEVDFIIDLSSVPPDGVPDPDIATISGLPLDWQQAAIDVEIVSGHIDFPAPTGEIVLHRDGTSIVCAIHGTVSAACTPGQSISVIVTFLFQNRTCGFVRRIFVLGEIPSPPPGVPLGIDVLATPPAVTICIFQTDKEHPGRLLWTLATPPGLEIPGMPQKLNDIIDLGTDPGSFIGDIYKAMPQIGPGNHLNTFRGLGEKLWKRAPAFFQKAYWALRKSLGEEFSIQFITTDPFVPWELMRPISDDDDVVADLIAVTHPVARCVGDSQGSLRHQLPAGSVVTIAPQYESANDRLERAQTETLMLQTKYSAVPVAGTYDDVWNLLTHGLASGTVSILHYAGHGDFPIGSADLSSIKLQQNRKLTALEVSGQEVKLGRKSGCLVVLNACQAGATGSVLGGVGGWASTFLEQRFGGFIAPLWAVDDTDAAIVAADLFDALINRKLPVSQALLAIRKEYGQRSPTYLAYLYYGDVGARVGPSQYRDA